MTFPEQESIAQSATIMVDVWAVPDGNQEAVLDRLTGLFEQLRRAPGFLEGSILRSVNPTRILTYARFDSPEAQMRAQDDLGTAAAIRGLRAIAHQDPYRYSIAASFLPPDD